MACGLRLVGSPVTIYVLYRTLKRNFHSASPFTSHAAHSARPCTCRVAMANLSSAKFSFPFREIFHQFKHAETTCNSCTPSPVRIELCPKQRHRSMYAKSGPCSLCVRRAPAKTCSTSSSVFYLQNNCVNLINNRNLLSFAICTGIYTSGARRRWQTTEIMAKCVYLLNRRYNTQCAMKKSKRDNNNKNTKRLITSTHRRAWAATSTHAVDL